MDMTTTTTVPEKRIPAGKLVAGLALLFLGVGSFTDAIDLWEFRNAWRLWPLGLILVGLACEADALAARKSDGSFILIGVGVWMLAASQRFMDLGYRSAMPLGIAVVGLGMIIHAIVDVPSAKENDRDHI